MCVGSDLFAFSIGVCIFSTVIAASRDVFAYMISARTHLLASIVCNWGATALKSFPLLFLWVSLRWFHYYFCAFWFIQLIDFLSFGRLSSFPF